MKKIIVCLTLIIYCITALSITSSAHEEYNWFIKKRGCASPSFPCVAKEAEKYSAYYIGNEKEKRIYLTFDAGYENGNIERILDVLREKKVSAAFFILSNLIYKNPDLVKRMVNEGHTVCNHTKNHKDMTTLSNDAMKSNLKSLDDQFEALTGVKMAKYFRFPEGRYNKEKVALCNSLGYRSVFWSAAYADWDNNAQADADWAFKKLISQTHPGAIYLLHPTSKTNADIMERLLDAWYEMGYKIGSITDIS